MLATHVLTVIAVTGYSMQAPELERVLSRASAYVRSYERALGMVIAREEYVQMIPIGSGAPPRGRPGDALAGFPRPEYQRRRLLSDFFMVHLAGKQNQWMGFRAVVEVDSRPVRDRQERLQELLVESTETEVERWQKLAEESARYNVGGFDRSTNVPTFTLAVLQAQHRERFDFERVGDAKVEGLDVWVIRYRERVGPTLITDRRGQEDVFAYGRLWIDPNDGRLVRTEVRTGDEDSEMRSEITVRYRPDAKLDLWVPHEMKEHYETPRGHYLDATAEYSEFQRFKVRVASQTPR